MRPQILDAPGEWLFALVMAASPIIGSIWVDPDVTKWIVLGVGVAMTVVTFLLSLKPAKRSAG